MRSFVYLVWMALCVTGCSPADEVQRKGVANAKDPVSVQSGGSPGCGLTQGDASTEVDSSSAVSEALTKGSWVKDLGAGTFHEEYVYEFAEDGTYASKHVTDHTTPIVSGRWSLSKRKDGELQLQLCDQEPGVPYYWLGEVSMIRYDKESDMLMVSGEGYAGEQGLRHTPGKRKLKGG